MNDYKTTVAQAFGAALREARKKANLSQEDLGLESGVDRTFLSMLERGIRQPALSTIFAICDAMAIKPAHLIDRVADLRKEFG